MSRTLGTPIVLERPTSSASRSNKPGAKKKPRLKDADTIERHLTRAMTRTVSAADKGLVRYKKASKKSSRSQRDGAIVDVIPNMTRGAAVTAGRMAPVSIDLMRAGLTPSVRRMTRQTVRSTARLINRS